MTAEAHWAEYRNTTVTARPTPTLSVLWLLRRAVLGPEEQHLGHVRDVVVRPGECRYPLVAGVVALLGGCEVFLPTAALACLPPEWVQLTSAVKLRRFAHRDGDLLLGAEILDRRLSTWLHRRPVRAHDLLLSPSIDGWLLSKVVIQNRVHRWLRSGQHDGLLDWKAVRTR
ncbi:hypothetical protein DFQ14_106159 [Halopolyspora algeriensis]|uniref:Uncharacterized protein n=1 Tax=Halopolyspora algeriensis TaxID=1500506 RepID=A0A368VPL8_9ACTN|nr:hypothetical protein [Halopolyspora algeriensis]RCW43681.1 hypothetical protein DFQ14_106159 [Halopolyspora algeriensis]TQM47535.1 hypothetical protein FHU43_3529 [Halopolyspora algeriensis]